MSADDKVQRAILPIPDVQHPGLITYDAKDPDTKFPPIRDVRPPKGAPNVLVILIDDVAYDGGGMGKGGTVTLYCDGTQVGTGRVDQTQGFIFSADETTDVGRETGTTVSPDYTAHTSTFTGKIAWVQIDLGDDAKDADHYIDPDERFRIAMARQ
jgi:hypothetical protein